MPRVLGALYRAKGEVCPFCPLAWDRSGTAGDFPAFFAPGGQRGLQIRFCEVENMKHVTATVKKSFALVLALVLALGMTACGNGESSSSETASSAASSEVSSEAVSSEAASSEAAGEEETAGSKTITLTVVHGDGTSNDITVSTDAENLRDALEAEGIIAGEDSSHGMFVQTVDGETADDGEQEWWCLTKGGEMWNYGVDDTEIADGDVYEFTLTVGY